MSKKEALEIVLQAAYNHANGHQDCLEILEAIRVLRGEPPAQDPML